MRLQLRDAVENLYRLFRAPVPQRIEACPCCRDPANYRVLHSKPLRDLGPDDLGSYTFSALYTVGAVEDLRYFLPRILELVVDDPLGYPGVEVVLKKLPAAGWRNWPKMEQQGIELFLSEWLQQLLEAEMPDGETVDSFLCGAAMGGCDLQPMLDRVAANRAVVREVFQANASSFWKKRRPSNAYWEGAPAEIYAQWLASSAVQSTL